MFSKPDAVQIVSCLAYRDAPKAIFWLKGAFGFEEKMVVPGDDGAVAHSELTLGPTMIMVSSEKTTGVAMKAPETLGGVCQSIYMIVADDEMVNSIYEQAKSAGAETVQPPEDQDFGGRLFVVKDPEGHIWSFGSYNPWSA